MTTSKNSIDCIRGEGRKQSNPVPLFGPTIIQTKHILLMPCKVPGSVLELIFQKRIVVWNQAFNSKLCLQSCKTRKNCDGKPGYEASM